ncbi:hypothetical protein AB0G32_20295 [Streptomyces sp. NPDC023723]|uniref:hypothetical protein n=1 Tax=Streptomyces sp. NPDC023723 TaxID=3154323 RepID=UPI0033DB50A5
MSDGPAHGHDFDTVYADVDKGCATTRFTWRDTDDGLGVVVEGHCPQCRGRTAREFRRALPGTGAKGLPGWLRRGAPRPETDEEVLRAERYFCACGHPHPNRPAETYPGRVGCGASWTLGEVDRSDGSGT